MLGNKKYDRLNALRRLPSIPIEFFKTSVIAKFRPILPTSFIYNVTWTCNARCVMCDNWKRSSDDDLSVDELSSIFKNKLFRKVRNVGLTGGEPYLRNDLPGLVRACGDNMPHLHKLTINTNGFTGDRILRLSEEIVRYGEERKFLIGIRVSIDGFEETHDKIRGIPGGYRKAIDTLMRLRELSEKYFFNVGISYTILPDNIQETEGMYQWAKENDINIVLNVPRFTASMMSNIHLEEEKGIRGNAAEIMVDLFGRLVREGSIFNGDIYLYHNYAKMVRNGGIRTMPCPMQTQGLQLNPNGDLFYCEQGAVVGNVRERDPLEIYRDKKNLRIRRKTVKSMCRRCLNPCMASVSAAQQVIPYVRFFFQIFWLKLFGGRNGRSKTPSKADA
jgi:MoaA/NifB/PqqE/SkfB family radical SAM enzyme